MSSATPVPPPYPSKEDFIAQGLSQVTLDNPHDCPICLEPIATTACRQTSLNSDSFPRASVHEDNSIQTPINADNHQHQVPETAIQIQYCKHIFGSTCLQTWLSASRSNRCPSCNQTLFPNKVIHLTFRWPTYEDRIMFVEMLEYRWQEVRMANLYREHLMSDQVAELMREVAITGLGLGGYEVTWEYLDEPSDGSEEDEDMSGEDDESEQMSEDGSEFTDTEERDEDGDGERVSEDHEDERDQDGGDAMDV